MSVVRWWRSGAVRLRRRRQLLVFSAPVALLIVVMIAKVLSVMIVGSSAATAYAERDSGALRSAVGTLDLLNMVEPAKTSFAAGTLAVLDNRLADADRQFAESLSDTEPAESCPVRVNLELVRETLGDRAGAEFDTPTAITQYLSARGIVDQAPPGCFAGNADTDPQRQALRNDAVPRLDRKIDALRVAPPPPPPPPGAAAPPPPPPVTGAAPADPDPGLRLNPGAGAPLDRLQQILRDAAAQGS